MTDLVFFSTSVVPAVIERPVLWQSPQDGAPDELGISAADLTALGWVDQDHAAAAAAALSAPLCLAAGASLQADSDPARQGPGTLPAEPAGELHAKSASQALTPAIPGGAVLVQEQHACRQLAGSQAQLASPSAAMSSLPAHPDSVASAGPPRSRKRAQPEPAEAQATQRSDDSALHACRQAAGLATALAPVVQSPVLHAESPAWLLQHVAALSASYTGVASASPSGKLGEEALSVAALIGRRVAFVLLEDFVAPPDTHLAACVIRAGLHSGRCDRLLHWQRHESMSHLSSWSSWDACSPCTHVPPGALTHLPTIAHRRKTCAECND